MQNETYDKWQSISKDYIAGEMRPSHKHSRAQLLYACEGVMLAATRQGRRIIAPYQALWIPAGIEHSITFLSATKMRSLYFDKSEYKDIFESKSIKVFAATALIRELIATLFQHQFPGAKQEMRRLLLLLVQETKAFNADVLLPEEEPLRSALNDLLYHRAWSTSAQELANKLNMTPRTFTRHFIRATGMSFRDWKHRMHLIFALEKIANGFPVKSAAILAGYKDASAFSIQFKNLYGACPSHFLKSDN